MSPKYWLRVYKLWNNKVAALIACTAATALATITLTASSASADYLTVYGGPIDTTATLGYTYFPHVVVNDAGTAVGNMDTYIAPYHSRIFRWDDSGAAAVELGNLGTNVYPLVSTGTAHTAAINNAGIAAGYARKWEGSVNKGYRAVRWDPSATSATELGNLGTDSSGVTHSQANAINDAGTAVGVARKYDGSGADMGLHPVRWNASSTAANELANLATNNSDMGSVPLAINNADTAVGYVAKYDDQGYIVGSRAVRWDTSGAATELESLGADTAGDTFSKAEAINAAGTTIGYSHKFDASGNYLGYRAVRWDASGTTATELQGVGAEPNDRSYATAINDAGTIVGVGTKNTNGGFPIRWDPSGTAATELGNLGTDNNGQTSAAPQDVNNAGFAVGYAYDQGSSFLGNRAVYWGLDGVAVNLNTLIDPTSGWLLWTATDISDTGWIAGAGFFDPDGVGGQPRLRRMFLMHVPATAVSNSLPGDFNNDSNVDAADYVVWRKIDGTQQGYDNWRANFGATAVGTAAVAQSPHQSAVPEPATTVLFGAGLVAVCGTVFHRSQLRRTRHRANRRHAVRRPRFEALEDRLTLSFAWDGVFNSYPPPDTVVTPPPPLLADFTNDGILDKLSVDFLHSRLSVRPGRGDGTFGDPIISGINAPNGGKLAVADFNADGRLDVFVASNYSASGAPRGDSHLGLENGSFRLANTYPLELGYPFEFPVAIRTVHNGVTGRTDVVIAGGNNDDYETAWVVLFNKGDWPSMAPALPGDYNRNGTVDAADYVVWRKTSGTQAGYNAWHANFGTSIGSGSGSAGYGHRSSGPGASAESLSAAVPEPSAIGFVALGAAAYVWLSRRRASASVE